MPLLRLTAVLLLACAASAQDVAPTTDADRAASFLLRSDRSGRTFAFDDLGADVLETAARRWAKVKTDEAAALASVLAAGKTGEAQLLPLLDRWQGKYRVAVVTSASSFLSDASAQATKLLADPGMRKSIEDAVAANESAPVVPGSQDAVERARKLRESRIASAGAFETDRDPGTGGGPTGTGWTGDFQAGSDRTGRGWF